MERRQFKRVSFFSRVTVDTLGNNCETHCIDISMRGILLCRPERTDWKLEQHLDITLTLSPTDVIHMRCSVVHIDDEFVGCVCDSLDLESLISLRRLIEVNLGGDEAANRELRELIRSVS